jgi:hypothetical protein
MKKQKTKIVIFSPSKLTKKVLEKNKDIYFYGDHKWTINSDVGEKEIGNTNNSLLPSDIPVSISEILKALEFWHPLIDRWVVGTWSHRKIKQRLCVYIQEIIFNLIKLDIKAAIFHTAVPHHLDTLSESISCQLLGIRQVYLVGQNIDGDILPVEQSSNIFSRKLLGLEVSLIKKNEKVKSYINRVKLGLKPLGTSKTNFLYKSIYFAFFFLTLNKILYSMIFLIKNFSLPSNKIVKSLDVDKFPFWSYFKLLLNQRDYILAYNKNVKNFRDQLQYNKNLEPCILIMAHYQPEATTFPLGGYFDSHTSIIPALREKGFKNRIFYREHPSTQIYSDVKKGVSQAGMYRDLEYLKILEQYECNFVSPYETITADMWKLTLPLTIGGSIAVERAVQGYCTIVMGEPWFKEMPGVIHINSIHSLDKINPEWLNYSKNIEKKSKIWLTETLSFKTIKNCPGISFGFKNKIPSHDKKSLEIYYQELNNLINML